MIATFYQDALRYMSDERLTLEQENIREAISFEHARAPHIHYLESRAAHEIDLERLMWKLDDILREQRNRS